MPPDHSASITEVTSKGQRYFRLDLSSDENGKRVTHDFHSRDSAESFKQICEEAWAKGLPTPVPDLGLPTPCSEASLIQVKNRSGSITYRVSFSIKGGKRHHRGFDSVQKAEQFQKLLSGLSFARGPGGAEVSSGTFGQPR